MNCKKDSTIIMIIQTTFPAICGATTENSKLLVLYCFKRIVKLEGESTHYHEIQSPVSSNIPGTE